MAVSQKSSSFTKTYSQFRDGIAKKNWGNGQRGVVVGSSPWLKSESLFSCVKHKVCNQSALRSIYLAHGSSVFHMKFPLKEKVGHQKLRHGGGIGMMSKLQIEIL